MSIRSLFATQIYRAPLRARGGAALRVRLERQCRQIMIDDGAGQRWSQRHYPGGYTSYNSLPRVQTLFAPFEQLQRSIDPHVMKFARALDLDLSGRHLEMTDCWINVMPRQVVHANHLHPLATISGTYYVSTPPRSSALKFEDPRLDRFMAAPPRKTRARPHNRIWVEVAPRAGDLVLFESWLRHEVPPNQSEEPRISVSFNYGWF